jgi:integrase
LRELISFLRKKRSSCLSIRLALQFATQHQHQQPAQWAARLRVVRGFARYRSGEDPHTEIPPLGLLPYRALRARPYLYSAKEIRELLNAAQHLHSTSTLKPWTYYCLFGLLATTGMRISEALNLQGKDVDWSEGVITIHGAKFGKSRLVPLHPSLWRDELVRAELGPSVHNTMAHSCGRGMNMLLDSSPESGKGITLGLEDTFAQYQWSSVGRANV